MYSQVHFKKRLVLSQLECLWSQIYLIYFDLNLTTTHLRLGKSSHEVYKIRSVLYQFPVKLQQFTSSTAASTVSLSMLIVNHLFKLICFYLYHHLISLQVCLNFRSFTVESTQVSSLNLAKLLTKSPIAIGRRGYPSLESVESYCSEICVS